jgi:hypothetical protein
MAMDEGDVTSWHLLGLGSTFDYHPVHFHGQTFIHKTAHKSHRGDVLEVRESLLKANASFESKAFAANCETWELQPCEMRTFQTCIRLVLKLLFS